jgi:hypothetical protein
LKQETAHSWTLGFVFQPTNFAEGLRVSVDYYNIELEDGIASVGTAGVTRACLNSGGASILCDRIIGVGDPVNGFTDIASIRAGSANAQKFTTSGVDIEAMYSLPLDRLFDNGKDGQLQ